MAPAAPVYAPTKPFLTAVAQEGYLHHSVGPISAPPPLLEPLVPDGRCNGSMPRLGFGTKTANTLIHAL